MSLESLNNKLDWWVQHNLNVLFQGEHGVGKTAMIKDCFERNNLKWLYYSAATMDPWVDFVGVPKEYTKDSLPDNFLIIKDLIKVDETGASANNWIKNNWNLTESECNKIVNYVKNFKEGPKYLELVRPQAFAFDEVQAIFFDEYNRSSKKVRNAVMELVQFKSINGKKFKNLKIVWAAINPDNSDSDYQVEEIDPAQLDRFEIKVEVPNKPNREWFIKNFGEKKTNSSVEWWDNLPPEIKKLISPRRLEYALRMFESGGDIRDVLPKNSNPSALHNLLVNGSLKEKLKELMKKNSNSETREFLKNENNYAGCIKYITGNEELMTYFVPLLPDEKISSLLSSNDKISDFIVAKSNLVPVFNKVCKEILEAKNTTKVIKKIKEYLTNNKAVADQFQNLTFESALKPHVGLKGGNWSEVMKECKKFNLQTTKGRSEVMELLKNHIPASQTANDSLTCLSILNEIAVELDATVIPSEEFSNLLLGITNNCIEQYHKNTNEKTVDMLNKHGHIVKNLFDYINKIKQSSKLANF